VIAHALLKLGSLGIAAALTLGVTSHLGPDLASRSMTGYVDQVSAAQEGQMLEVDRIGADLAREWRALAGVLGDAVDDLADSLTDAADGVLGG
jgi:hypothetical protein